jgi:site-specific recombinase XerC
MQLTLDGSRTSFERYLKAEGKAPRTIETYLSALDQFTAHLARAGHSGRVKSVTRDDILGWIVAMQEAGNRPGGISVRVRALRAYWKWLVEDDELKTSPMEKVRTPKVVVQPPPVLDEDAIVALLATCNGKGFADRRDTAILRLLLDTGLRRAGLTGLRLSDIDLDQQVCVITLKGGRRHIVWFGDKTARAIDRYLRLREQHPHRDSTALWLGERGPLRANSILQIVRRRAKQAGLGRTYTHMLRHTYAHRWLAAGGGETDLMANAGWRSREMLNRYGASAAAERARKAAQRLALGDTY